MVYPTENLLGERGLWERDCGQTRLKIILWTGLCCTKADQKGDRGKSEKTGGQIVWQDIKPSQVSC